METEAPNLVGKILSDRYRIERFLDEGGMGAVYLAEHLFMRKRFAVKVLRPEMTRVPEAVKRFEREALAVAHIDHPNVAAATDFGKFDDGSFFLVLEYVEGASLSELIAQGPFDVGRALHVTRQIASGLARAHSLGIVHRDLKPDNVMLVEREGDPDFVKILDFGIAKVPVASSTTGDGPAGSTTQVGRVFGTPTYMSPEQALGRSVDARADLYALGVMMFEMLAGVCPFQAEGEHMVPALKVMCDPPGLASANPDVHVPDAVEAIVMRLLEREAGARFQNAEALLDAIEACGSWVPRTRPSARPPALPRISTWSRVERALPLDILAGVGAALLLFFVGVVFLRSPVLVAPIETPAEFRSDAAASIEKIPAAQLDTTRPEPADAPKSSFHAPITAAMESARRATPSSKIRPKRSYELTDFGGRH